MKQRKKIFVDGYGLSELRDYMETKGWIVKRNKETYVYDFKTSYGCTPKELEVTSFSQVVNHFIGVKCITTKYGLT